MGEPETVVASMDEPDEGASLAPQDRWFEDWQVGDVVAGEMTYVMNQERMLGFSNEFDPQMFHTDVEAAKQSIYGGLIASGWHTGAAMMRLITETLGESSLGASGVDELRWPRPVRAGDELRLTSTVLESRASVSKPDRGILRVRQELKNQHGDVVMSSIATMFLRTRAGVRS